MGSRDVDLGEIDGDQQRGWLIHGRFCKDLARGSGHKTLSPKLKAVPTRWTLVSNAIRHRHITPIGDGVCSLNGFPCEVLIHTVLGLLTGMPSDRCWIKEDFRALHCGQACSLRKPLVPTNQNP